MLCSEASSGRAGCSSRRRLNLAAAAKGLAGSRRVALRSIDWLRESSTDRPFRRSLLLDGANPVFTSPKAWRVREALEKVPYIVSFGSFLDETAALSDLILPDHSFLESWAEALPESGSMVAVASVAPAAMMPLHQTRSTPDVLLDVGRRLARPLNLPWETFEALLTETFAALPMTSTLRCVDRRAGKRRLVGHASRRAATAASSDAPGEADRVRGAGIRRRRRAVSVPLPAVPVERVPRWVAGAPAVAAGDAGSADVGDVEQLDRDQPRDRRQARHRDGDVVDVTSAHGTLRTAAIVSPGIAPDLVAMPAGQGHQTFTRYASGRGENPIDLLAPMTEPRRAPGVGGDPREDRSRRRSGRTSDSVRRWMREHEDQGR